MKENSTKKEEDFVKSKEDLNSEEKEKEEWENKEDDEKGDERKKEEKRAKSEGDTIIIPKLRGIPNLNIHKRQSLLSNYSPNSNFKGLVNLGLIIIASVFFISFHPNFNSIPFSLKKKSVFRMQEWLYKTWSSTECCLTWVTSSWLEVGVTLPLQFLSSLVFLFSFSFLSTWKFVQWGEDLKMMKSLPSNSSTLWHSFSTQSFPSTCWSLPYVLIFQKNRKFRKRFSHNLFFLRSTRNRNNASRHRSDDEVGFLRTRELDNEIHLQRKPSSTLRFPKTEISC